MWRLSFVLHEMAFGLLSIFIPLYTISLGGSLIHVGLMSSMAILLSIPASFLWGYLCDRSRRYKPYILLAFLTLAVVLYIFTLTRDISLLIILYALMAFLHMAHEPPKNILIAESHTRRYWEKAYALYEGVTELGWLTGTLIGLYISTQGFSAQFTLTICSVLNLAAFTLAIFLISDPGFIFERSLVKVENSVLYAYRGLTMALRAVNGVQINMRWVDTEKPKVFCCALTFFFMATRMLFTPLPIFFSKNLAQSIVYALFCINSAGGVIGYLLVNSIGSYAGRGSLYKISALRSILTFLLIAVGCVPAYDATLAAIILFLLGLAYAVFHVLSLSISMEILPEEMAGIFNLVAGLGEALGSFIGSFIAEKFGFIHLFLGAGITFLTTCIILKVA